MKRLAFLMVYLAFSSFLSGQALYLDSMFAVQKDTLQYGTALNYRGCMEDLFLDLYKPVNQLTSRPVLVLVHGGAFVNGSRHAPSIARWADSLASRGYVVASIDYRKGFHHRNVSGSFGCAVFQGIFGTGLSSCEYPQDSSEVIRAIYRANQDAKAAVRFLRGRSVLDSTSKENVFMGGESAGAFISLQMAFWDKVSEKPVDAGALPPATNSPNLPCIKNNPCGVALPGDLSRPDLGDINGNINLNGESSCVKAVVAMYGGLIDPAILQNDSATPGIYVFHQSCDPVVDCQRDVLLHDMSNCIYFCSGCPGLIRYPKASGSCALVRDILNGGIPVNDLYVDTIANGQPINSFYGCIGVDPSIPSCNNTSLYGCHSVAYNHQRIQSIADFLYPSVAMFLVGPEPPRFRIYPNPAARQFNIAVPRQGQNGFSWELYSLEGRVLEKGVSQAAKARVNVAHLSKGTYLIKITRAGEVPAFQKLVVSEG